jgi:hypothetical protein
MLCTRRNVLKYDKIVMMGLSGGGWSTTIAAAVSELSLRLLS